MAAPASAKMVSRRKNGVIRAKSDFFRTARYGLTVLEHRIIYYAILRGQQEKRPFEPVELTIKEFIELCDYKGKSIYNKLSDLTNKLAGRTVEVVYKTPDGQHHLLQAPWLSKIEYIIGEGKLIIAPNKELQPFFDGKPFSQTEFYFLIKFKSQYAERLYEMVKPLSHKPMADFSIDELRSALAIPPEMYTNFKDLRVRVLEPALKDINKYTDLEITMKTAKHGGKKVQTILFLITKKEVAKLAERVSAGEFSPPLDEQQQEDFLRELLSENERPTIEIMERNN